MKKRAVIFMCAVAIASAVPSVPAFAANNSVVVAAKSRTGSHSRASLRDTAQSVQIAFQNKDMEKLAGLCNYPLAIVYSDGTLLEIKDKSAFKKLSTDVIFSRKMQDAIASTNAARLQEVGNAGAHMGDDNGLNLYKFNNKWKVNNIYLDSAVNEEVRITNMKEAAVIIQKTFSYKDLETLAKLCNYPVAISMENGNLKEIKNQQELMAMGEDKIFTKKLSKAIDTTDVDKLTDGGKAGVQLGGDSGLAIFNFNGAWKINSIYQ